MDERVEHLFVIRIWRERARSHAAWRGSIRHVPSGAQEFFSRLADVDVFISHKLEREHDHVDS